MGSPPPSPAPPELRAPQVYRGLQARRVLRVSRALLLIQVPQGLQGLRAPEAGPQGRQDLMAQRARTATLEPQEITEQRVYKETQALQDLRAMMAQQVLQVPQV